MYRELSFRTELPQTDAADSKAEAAAEVVEVEGALAGWRPLEGAALEAVEAEVKPWQRRQRRMI